MNNSRQPIAESSLTGLRPTGVGGRRVLDSWEQIHHVLRDVRTAGDNATTSVADLFAEPEMQPGGGIVWFGPQGTVRAYRDLDPPGQLALRRTLDDQLRLIAVKVAELRGKNDSSSSDLAATLENAQKLPGSVEDALFAVDHSPLLINWSLESERVQGAREALREFARHQAPAPIAVPVQPAPPPAAPEPPPPPPPKKESKPTVAIAAVEAEPVVVIELVVGPAEAKAPIGSTVSFNAVALYSDKSTADVTAAATWECSAPTVATIARGNAVGIGTGATRIRATLGATTGEAAYGVPNGGFSAAAVSGYATLEVYPTLVKLEIAPPQSTITVGQLLQCVARATYSDGTVADVTHSVTWTVSEPPILTIHAPGAVFGQFGGVAFINASLEQTNATGEVHVQAPVAPVAAVTPSHGCWWWFLWIFIAIFIIPAILFIVLTQLSFCNSTSLFRYVGRGDNTPIGRTEDGLAAPLRSPASPSSSEAVTAAVDVAARLAAHKVVRGEFDVALIWDGPEDLDLHVQQPDGQDVYFGHRVSRSEGASLELDVDANRACGSEHAPIEHVKGPASALVNGGYRIKVVTFATCSAKTPSAWRVVLTIPGRPPQQFVGSADTQDNMEFVVESFVWSPGATPAAPAAERPQGDGAPSDPPATASAPAPAPAPDPDPAAAAPAAAAPAAAPVAAPAAAPAAELFKPAAPLRPTARPCVRSILKRCP